MKIPRELNAFLTVLLTPASLASGKISLVLSAVVVAVVVALWLGEATPS
jgi:hypothetical protein